MIKLTLNGIMPPLTTPFDERGEVDFESLRRNVERYNETGLSGYVALGSNGEAVHLNGEERAKIVETIKTSAAPGHRIIAGVNELSTSGAVQAAQRAAGAGADAVLVITPYFYKSSMTQAALDRHFTEVAEKSPLPVLMYNVPQNTGVVLEPPTIVRLGEHPNIIGIKDSAGNFNAIAETIRLAPEQFSVLAGNGGILYPALAMGAAGAVLAVACAAPRACVDLYEAVKSGDFDKARKLQEAIAPISHLVTAGFGVAGLKAVMDMVGFEGGTVRAPLVGADTAVTEKIRATMRASGLFSRLD
jgi:4-hydroxy-2-oxoglutarate aldolase